MSESLLKVRLRDQIRPDGVGAIWCDDREILQRIFVTVRDENWREIAPTDSKSDIDDASGIATLVAHHESNSVGFEWTGTFHLSEDRQNLRFDLVGRILRDMRACRVGLVVLHPVESMIGSSVIAVGPQVGHEITPTNVIAPQPVLNGVPQAMTDPFYRLKIERADFGRLELAFEGDLFELEDQRNWGDASFKTYCTPLRLGFPRELKAGTLIKHSVEARFTPPEARTRVLLNPYRTGVFPRLGREWSPPQATPRTQQASRSNWAYVYFDAGVLGDPSELREVLDHASSALSIGIEVGAGTLPSEAVDLLADQRSNVAQLLVYGSGTSLPSIEAISRCRQDLQKSAPGWEPSLLAATRGYFVELNRRTPFSLPVSGTAFPLTATVHSGEREMIASNVSAIADMASTGFRLTGVSQLSITPLALYYPRSRMTQPFPTEMVGPWLVATLIHAALGGIDEVTLANDILTALSTLESGGMDFISRLTGLADKEVASFRGGLPTSLHAVKFITATENEPQVLASNLSSRGVEISLAWWGFKPRIAIDALTGQPIAHNDSGLVVPGYSVILLQT